MVISMLNYHADEFMEVVLGHHDSAEHVVRDLFSETALEYDALASQKNSSISSSGGITPSSSDDGLNKDTMSDVLAPLLRFKTSTSIY